MSKPSPPQWLLLLGLAVLALYPLAGSQLLLGHDAERYVPRVVEFDAAVRHGHVPPVWAAHLSRGHGQPLFEFAPPLLYALGLPVLWAGLGLARAIQLPVLVLTLAGALALGELVARRFSPRGRSLAVGAMLFAPYLQVDIYVRAAYAEACALVILPVVLLAIDRVVAAPTGREVAMLALAVGALALTHPPGMALGLATAGVFLVALTAGAPGAARSRRWRRGASAGVAGVVLGLGLSAFSWLPAWSERDLVKTHLLVDGDLHYGDHFVQPWQLLWSPWGFGLSTAGSDDGMPFFLGPVHLLLAGLGGVIGLRRADRQLRWFTAAALVVTLGSCWVATDWSAVLWRTVAPLQYFAYPWRLLALPAVMLPLLAGIGASGLESRWIRAVALALLVAVNFRHVGAWGVRTMAPEELDPERIARLGVVSSLFDEYEPNTAQAGLPYQPRPLETISHGATVTPSRITTRLLTPERQVFGIVNSAPLIFVARTFYYPGWSVVVDGADLACGAEPTTGRLQFELPPGEHEVVIELRATPVRYAGQMLSVVAIIVVIGLVGAAHRRRPSDAEAL